LDTGVIGIVDLDTKKVSTMKTKHSSVNPEMYQEPRSLLTTQ
jgi:hypothetical protein